MQKKRRIIVGNIPQMDIILMKQLRFGNKQGENDASIFIASV
jgi:hypothetical protein